MLTDDSFFFPVENIAAARYYNPVSMAYVGYNQLRAACNWTFNIHWVCLPVYLGQLTSLYAVKFSPYGVIELPGQWLMPRAHRMVGSPNEVVKEL